MKLSILIFILCILAIQAPTYAQEFNSQSEQLLSTQISTLRNLLGSSIEDMRTLLADMQKELDAFRACAGVQKVYSPAAATADEDGCVAVGLSLGQTLPISPNCADIPMSPSSTTNFYESAKSDLTIMSDGRLGILYTGTGRIRRCNGNSSFMGTTCTRVYDGKDFSECSCSRPDCPSRTWSNSYGN